MRVPVDLPAWKSLQTHAAATRETHMRDLFAKDAKRGETFSLRWNDILVDYSKNRVHAENHRLPIERKAEA